MSHGSSYVYIMTNGANTVLYTGSTTNLPRRFYEHSQGLIPGFTSKYHATKLVYYEEAGDLMTAVAREKQIKGWSRSKKIALIEAINPFWIDLGESLNQ